MPSSPAAAKTNPLPPRNAAGRTEAADIGWREGPAPGEPARPGAGPAWALAGEAKPAFDRADRPTGWNDEFWAAVVGSVDALLRAYYGIREFTGDPDCVVRIALDPAREPITLSDGTQIASGEMVGALHLWNEHLQRYSPRGPDLGWAEDMRRRIRHSLRLLADHIQRDPAWRPVRAFRADATWSSRLGTVQIRRVAERYGFELVEPGSSMLRQLHAIGDSFIVWALTRGFNPSALPRQPFLRARHELWISRSTLLRRYRREAPRAGGRQPDQAA